MNTNINNKRYLPSEIERLYRLLWKIVLSCLAAVLFVFVSDVLLQPPDLFVHNLKGCLIFGPVYSFYILALVLLLLRTVSIARQKNICIAVVDGIVTITAPRSVFGLRIFTESLDVRKIRSYEIKKFQFIRGGYEHRKLLIRMHSGEEKKFIVDNLYLVRQDFRNNSEHEDVDPVKPSVKLDLAVVLLLLTAFAVPLLIPYPTKAFLPVVYILFISILFVALWSLVKSEAKSLEDRGELEKGKRYLVIAFVGLSIIMAALIFVLFSTGWAEAMHYFRRWR